MYTAQAIVGVSIIVQAVAVIAALRLHWKYGHRWAWSVISLALVLMTVRRGITFYRMLQEGGFSEPIDEPLPELASALMALAISLLLLLGVGLIEPVFRDFRRAQSLLTGERDSLAERVRANEVEFRLARDIQQSLFPDAPPELPGFDISGACQPALSASGDLFDYLPLPDGSLGIVVADVSGHGVGPAMIMAETRAYLRALSQTTQDCGELLTRLNEFLCGDNSESAFVTCFLAKVDPRQRVLEFAAAGHVGYRIDAQGNVTRLTGSQPPLRLMQSATYESQSRQPLAEGDIVLLVTDGLLDAESAREQRFGAERLSDVVRRTRHNSARDMISELFRAVGEFSNWKVQADDITAVIVKVAAAQ